MRVAAPEGWIVLRPGSPYVPVDSAELVALLHDATQARAVVALDPDLHPGETLDRALDRFVERWRTRVPDLVAGARSAVPLGSVPGRRVEVTWKHEDEPTWFGQAVAWPDASRTLFFAAWYPTGAAEKAVPEVESLTAALSVLRPLSARIAATTVKAASELPQMTPHAIEILVARRPRSGPAHALPRGARRREHRVPAARPRAYPRHGRDQPRPLRPDARRRQQLDGGLRQARPVRPADQPGRGRARDAGDGRGGRPPARGLARRASGDPRERRRRRRSRLRRLAGRTALRRARQALRDRSSRRTRRTSRRRAAAALVPFAAELEHAICEAAQERAVVATRRASCPRSP